jgi:hypothetical protein
VDGRPYGVDVIIPVRYDEEAEARLGKSDLHELIPAAQQKFMDGILAAEGVPELPPDECARVHAEIANGYGGIARGSQVAAMLALGAAGVWCGTVWLGTRESELTPFAKSALFNARTEDAVRRRCRTGKTVRMLKSKLSEAWEQPGAPPYLQAPLQGILFNEITARVLRAERADLLSIPAGAGGRQPDGGDQRARGDVRDEARTGRCDGAYLRHRPRRGIALVSRSTDEPRRPEEPPAHG